MYLQINPQHHTVDFALFIQNTAGSGRAASLDPARRAPGLRLPPGLSFKKRASRAHPPPVARKEPHSPRSKPSKHRHSTAASGPRQPRSSASEGRAARRTGPSAAGAPHPPAPTLTRSDVTAPGRGPASPPREGARESAARGRGEKGDGSHQTGTWRTEAKSLTLGQPCGNAPARMVSLFSPGATSALQSSPGQNSCGVTARCGRLRLRMQSAWWHFPFN
ncbi:uncharacterized protein [Manis javanica]|uniref:uncharacterized protein n=1 Tax=Manis javanica TaxID=9974 RepID=UPI00187A9C72|nr:translation initiation factor IF-2-like [Manis javanica]